MGWKICFRGSSPKMADTKNKAQTNGVAKPTKDSSLQTILKLLKHVHTDSHEFQAYDQLVDAHKSLQKKLDDETKIVTGLKVKCNKLEADLARHKQETENKEVLLTNAFGERYCSWKQTETVIESSTKENAELRAQLQAAKAELMKHRDTVKQHGKELTAYGVREKSASSEIERLKIQVKKLNAELQQCEIERDDHAERMREAELDLGAGVLTFLDEIQLDQL